MTVADALKLINDSCRLIIESDKELLYNDWAGMGSISEELKAAELKGLQFRPEITHRQYKELGLMQPLTPEDTPAYKFSDLELRLYYVLQI